MTKLSSDTKTLLLEYFTRRNDLIHEGLSDYSATDFLDDCLTDDSLPDVYTAKQFLMYNGLDEDTVYSILEGIYESVYKTKQTVSETVSYTRQQVNVMLSKLLDIQTTTDDSSIHGLVCEIQDILED